MYKSSFVLLFLAALFTFVACVKNPQDTDDPSLTLAENAATQSVRTGEAVDFTVSCADDVSLAFVEGRIICPLSQYDETFRYEVIGQNLDFTSGYDLNTDDLSTEECTMVITCIDDNNNVSNSEMFSFDIVNGLDSTGPSITLDSLRNFNNVVLDSLENGIELVSGTSIDVLASIKDVSNNVAEIRVFFENENQVFDEATPSFEPDTLIMIDEKLFAPNLTGFVDLTFETRDGKNNLSTRTYSVTITN